MNLSATHPPQSAANASVNQSAHNANRPTLLLTDFVDLPTLQEIQDSFTAVTRLAAVIRDAEGNPLTRPTDTRLRDQSDQFLDQLIISEEDDCSVYMAPIRVEGEQIGSIAVDCDALPTDEQLTAEPLRAAAKRIGLEAQRVDELLEAMAENNRPNRAAAIQFLHLLANSIARLCYEEYKSRQRADELSILHRISTALTGVRDVQAVLDTAAESVAKVMQVKAVSIRLLTADDQLVPRAVCNLSREYLSKGGIEPSRSELFRHALRGETTYVENMATDARVLFPQEAQREGLASMLCAGMIFQGKPIGTVQLFTDTVRKFTSFETKLVQAIAQLLATAIENARLDAQRRQSKDMMRQLTLAADVQRRMLPSRMPNFPPFDIAARYVPSFQLGGDFFDFVKLEGNLGVAVGDVVGKGVAASLLMASVRASLRAYAQDVYDLDEIIARVNIALTRDTLDNEFATLWYGVLDPRSMRLTYCNAGHEPPLLLRKGEIVPLATGGMLVGVDAGQEYEKGLIDLRPGDVILLYTDGLPDAFSKDEVKFGRPRIEQALREAEGHAAADILNHVLWTMRRFTGLRRSFDDTTLVTIKVGAKFEIAQGI